MNIWKIESFRGICKVPGGRRWKLKVWKREKDGVISLFKSKDQWTLSVKGLCVFWDIQWLPVTAAQHSQFKEKVTYTNTSMDGQDCALSSLYLQGQDSEFQILFTHHVITVLWFFPNGLKNEFIPVLNLRQTSPRKFVLSETPSWKATSLPF